MSLSLNDMEVKKAMTNMRHIALLVCPQIMALLLAIAGELVTIALLVI